MKKKIGLISLDSSTLVWLKDKLRFQGSGSICGEELLEGIEELVSGAVSAVMLEMDNGEHIPVSDNIVCGSLSVNPTSRKVLLAGEAVSLTPKEFDILYFLAKNKGEVFTKEQIYKAVWEDDFLLADSNIMAFIRKLRKKIEPDPDSPEYILTIWGIGYKFNDSI